LQSCSRLVFVDGVYQADGSTPAHGQLPAEAFALNLNQAIEERRDVVEADLGRHADPDENAFVAMNTALFDDGAVIYVADGVVAERPVVLQFVSTGGPERRATNHRILVVLGLS